MHTDLCHSHGELPQLLSWASPQATGQALMAPMHGAIQAALVHYAMVQCTTEDSHEPERAAVVLVVTLISLRSAQDV